MTSPAAFGGIRAGIRGTAVQPILAGQGSLARPEVATSEDQNTRTLGRRPDRYMLRELAGIAIGRGSAYPVAEF